MLDVSQFLSLTLLRLLLSLRLSLSLQFRSLRIMSLFQYPLCPMQRPTMISTKLY